MSRFIKELENMPLENDIVKLLNDTLKKENKTKKPDNKIRKIRPLYDALQKCSNLPIEIAGKNEMIFNGYQYGDDFDTGRRVWRLYDYYDNNLEQFNILVSIVYDSSSYDGDDFESVEFKKVTMKEVVILSKNGINVIEEVFTCLVILITLSCANF